MTSPTLAELKAAIEAVPPQPEFDREGYVDPPDDVIARFRGARVQYEEARADAWRTYALLLEKNVGIGYVMPDVQEGMRLVREHLR